MRIYCLSSITKIPIQTPLIIPIPYEKGSDELCLKTINASLTPSNLTKFFANDHSSAYKLTEICIGHEEVEFHESEQPKKIYVMKVYQTDTKLLTFKMIRGSVTKIPLENEDFAYDFFVAASKLWPNEMSSDQVDYDLKIRVRCIKNTTDSGLITSEAELAYNNFAKQIENFCNEEISQNPNLTLESVQENAFQKLPPLEIPNTTINKVLYEKMRNFQSAIDLLCDPSNGRYKNVPVNFKDPITNKNVICRFNQKAECLLEQKESNWYVKNPRSSLNSHTNEFRDCTKLIWEKVSSTKLNNETKSGKIKFDDAEFLSRFNDFDFQKLTNVHLKNVDLFLSKTFVHPILKRMNFQTISFMVLNDCKITGLNDEFFDLLSSSFEIWLEFPNNDISFISDSISKVTKLKGLNLNGNKNLNNFPWNHLPSKIEKLELDGTNILQIPKEIERLISLKEFQASSDNLEHISWKNFPPKIQSINVKGGGKQINDIELKNKENLFVLSVVNLKLQKVDPSNLSPTLITLNLSENELKDFDTSKLKDQLPDLDKLCITKNKLNFISWKDLPEDLSVIDLSNNLLTSIEDPHNSEDDSIEKLMDESLNISPPSIDKILEYVKQILLDNNELTYLPKNFENLKRLRYLGLSNNYFNLKNGNIHEKLWNRLPKKFNVLRLSGNKLGFIPCDLQNFQIEKLFIDNCKLFHICPYLHTKFQNDGKQRIPDGFHMTINISGNFKKLKNLSFIPSKIYPMPNSKEKPIVEVSHNQMIDASKLPTTILICSNMKKEEMYRDTTKTKYTKNVYEFGKDKEPIILPQIMFSEPNSICYCCASCGKKSKESPIFEQYMVMDSILQIQEEPPIYFEPGKWKTKVKSRLCNLCLKEFKKKIDEAYEEFNTGKLSSTKKKKHEIVSQNSCDHEIEEPQQPLPRRGRPPKSTALGRPLTNKSKTNPQNFIYPIHGEEESEEENGNNNNESLMDYDEPGGPSNAFPPIQELLRGPSRIIIIDQNEAEVTTFERIQPPYIPSNNSLNINQDGGNQHQLSAINENSIFAPNLTNSFGTSETEYSEPYPTNEFSYSSNLIQYESNNDNPTTYYGEEEFFEQQQNNETNEINALSFNNTLPHGVQYYNESSQLLNNEELTSNVVEQKQNFFQL